MPHRLESSEAPEAVTAHRVRNEALRRAELEPPTGQSLEATLARISAQVTAEAAARRESVKDASTQARTSP
jgi:hypothetical protein